MGAEALVNVKVGRAGPVLGPRGLSATGERSLPDVWPGVGKIGSGSSGSASLSNEVSEPDVR